MKRAERGKNTSLVVAGVLFSPPLFIILLKKIDIH
jgi:hypothetical protein